MLHKIGFVKTCKIQSQFLLVKFYRIGSRLPFDSIRGCFLAINCQKLPKDRVSHLSRLDKKFLEKWREKNLISKKKNSSSSNFFFVSKFGRNVFRCKKNSSRIVPNWICPNLRNQLRPLRATRKVHSKQSPSMLSTSVEKSVKLCRLQTYLNLAQPNPDHVDQKEISA